MSDEQTSARCSAAAVFKDEKHLIYHTSGKDVRSVRDSTLS